MNDPVNYRFDIVKNLETELNLQLFTALCLSVHNYNEIYELPKRYLAQ